MITEWPTWMPPINLDRKKFGNHVKKTSGLFLVPVLFLAGMAPSCAHVWQTIAGDSPRGLKFVTLRISLNEFAMEFHCDEHDWQDGRLGVKFFSPPLPALHGEDGETARLSLLFTRGSGEVYRVVWDAYYFDGGPGDQAWLGSINAGKPELDALTNALQLDLANNDAEVIYSFRTTGSAVGVAEIQDICKLGLQH